jgi:hypothetical protein
MQAPTLVALRFIMLCLFTEKNKLKTQFIQALLELNDRDDK